MEFLEGNTITYIMVGILVVILVIYFVIKKKGSKGGQKKEETATEKIKITKKKNESAVPKSVRESIPYAQTHDGNIIETTPGVYTRCYEITDINFKIATDEEQTTAFIKYERFLNSLDRDVKFQILIQNKSSDKNSTFNNIRFLPQSDSLNKFRRLINDILLKKMSEGRNNITQNKYLVISVKASGIEEAIQRLDEAGRTADKKFREISKEHPLQMLTLEERLENLFFIYNQDGEGCFYNSKVKDGNPAFDLSQALKTGLTTKDIIGPGGMEFKTANYFTIGNTYGRALYLASLPNWLSTDFLSDLSDIMCNMLISINYESIEQSKALKIVHNMMINIDGQIASRQKRASQEGYSADMVSPELLKQQKYARDLINDMTARDQKMFLTTFAVTVFAKSKEELEKNTRTIIKTAEDYLCSLRTLFYQQEEGFNMTLPLAINNLKVSKMLTTESAAVFIPYTTQELHQKNGLYYGINDTSKSMILYDRLSGENYNGLYFGESGNGKSTSAKFEMMQAYLKSQRNVIYVIDPEGEYAALADALAGETIDLSPNAKTFLNPLDLDIGYGDEASPLGMKTDYIISMIEIMFGNGRIMAPEERSIITRCVQAIYRPYLDAIDAANRAGKNITIDRYAAPTLNTLYAQISAQPEPAAKGLAAVLEMYATGALSTFAHRSNVNTDARFVVYDIKNLGTGTKDLGIHICLNDIWNKMIENEKKGIYTWFYIDECQLLLNSESSADFLASIWQRARKRKGVPTGIFQNTENILKSMETRAILNNTSFIEMLSLRHADRANLAEHLSISESQISYITDAGAGKGLIYAGKTLIPFDNTIPEGEIYDLFDTRKEIKEPEARYSFSQR